ncbi:MAG: hypothetical protein WBG54_17090 [Acidobacteriaceae bacterium]
MKPQDLKPEDFRRYTPVARQFAESYLSLLRQLPIAICPSFLQQIGQLDTSFPAEQAALRWQCDSLSRLPAAKLAELTEPFQQIRIPPSLRAEDWVNAPAGFISSLAAALWSNGQIDAFRRASEALFGAIPDQGARPSRLTIVVFGQGARPEPTPLLEKLSRTGVLLTNMQAQQMPQQIFEAFRRHAAESGEAYAHWYVDGGDPWPEAYHSIPGTVAVSYPELNPVRVRTLKTMEEVVQSGNAGAEDLRTRLFGMNGRELGTDSLSADPVLRRFYTDLFTESSGPQIFSTTFVQWTGRELARRAQPRTLLLRYAPRQRYQPFNTLLREDAPRSLDPEGSLRDAEIGAYYTWIEMSRITDPGKGSFVAWLEGSSLAVVIGRGSPAGAQSTTPLSLEQALNAFC